MVPFLMIFLGNFLMTIYSIAGQSDASITACYSTGNVTATADILGSYVGGVVGLNNIGAILTACYATGNVKGDG